MYVIALVVIICADPGLAYTLNIIKFANNTLPFFFSEADVQMDSYRCGSASQSLGLRKLRRKRMRLTYNQREHLYIT
jgi:hypothetical protein